MSIIIIITNGFLCKLFRLEKLKCEVAREP